MKLTDSSAWKTLQLHLEDEILTQNLSRLSEQPDRFKALSFTFDQLFIDFSKQKLTQETFKALINLADQANLKTAIQNMMRGDNTNITENRAALHTALRLPPGSSLLLQGQDINHLVQEQLKQMTRIIDELTSAAWRGYSGKPITDVVNLGVGGSDLGPLLACHALDEFKVNYTNPVNVHFASTMDGSQVSLLFDRLNPETTIFIIASKSFSTIDTLSNASSAREWLLSHFDDEAIINKQHFIGISTDQQKMTQWGIHPQHQLMLWDWVGGRFSLWSTVGLSIALKIGMDGFRQLLDGAHALDQHFSNTEFSINLPVLLGLVGIWNTNFLKINAHAILPYDARLKYFPDYLMQLEMESNGKSATIKGSSIDYDTCPVIWGEVGPNAQHAFYQLLHQGTRKVTSDFIAPVNRFAKQNGAHEKSLRDQHRLTLANCFAQSRALMVGSSSTEEDLSDALASHKHYPGEQPSTTLLIQELTPYSLGQLIALYEHKTFVMATIWGINPFDQWGVELGKTMAQDTLSALNTAQLTEKFDPSTNGLINHFKGTAISSDKSEPST